MNNKTLVYLWATDQFDENGIDVAADKTLQQKDYTDAIISYLEEGVLKKVPHSYLCYTFTAKGRELVEGIIRKAM